MYAFFSFKDEPIPRRFHSCYCALWWRVKKMDSQQVLDLGGQPITLKKIKGKMKDEGSVESVEGSVE